MSDLTPLEGVRSEHFLNGEDLKPITRKEHFYAGQESKLPEGHQEPETREEWFIKKFRGGGSSVTVEALTVTDNGTYSEEGIAYSPVTVNVDKGLEVVDLPSAEVVSFDDGEALPITSGKFYINAEQDLNGYSKPWVGGSGKNKAKVTNKGKDETTPLNAYNCSLQISENEFILTPTNSSVESYFGALSYSSSTSESSFNTYYSTRIEENTEYTFSLSNNNFDKNIIQFFDDSYNVIYQNGAIYKQFTTNTGTVTAPTGATWMVCRIGMSSGTAGTAYKTTLQIEEGSSATAWQPYENICPITGFSSMDITVTPTESASDGKTQTISFGTTNYGGYYDSVSGKLFTTFVKNVIDENSSITFRSASKCCIWFLPSAQAYTQIVSGGANVICDRLESNYFANYDSAQEGQIGTMVTPGGGTHTGVSFKISDNFTSVEDVKAWLANNPLTIVTNLATPIETDISATCITTLEGTNNIYHNCNGNTEISILKEA